MADIYVWDGATGANNGTSWTDAYVSIGTADTNAVAGDRILVSSAHNELRVINTSFAWNASFTAPNQILSCDHTQGSVTLKAGARIGVATTYTFTISAGSTYHWGITYFTGGTGTSVNNNLIPGGNSTYVTKYENCRFELRENAVNDIDVRHCEFINCTFWFRNSGQSFTQSAASSSKIKGGGISTAVNTDISGNPSGAQLTALYTTCAAYTVVDGFDMSAMGASFNIVSASGSSLFAVFRNCKLPTGWNGSVHSAQGGTKSYVLLANSGSGDEQYRMELKSYYGSVKSDTVTYRANGPAPNGQPISWKVVAASTVFPATTMDCPEIVFYNTGAGSKTLTLHVLRDSVTNLTNKDVWVEVTYKNAAGSTLAALDNSSMGHVVNAAVDLAADSAASWTHSMTNPNKQKVTVTINPQEEGPIQVLVRVAAATTVYVCPKVEIA